MMEVVRGGVGGLVGRTNEHGEGGEGVAGHYHEVDAAEANDSHQDASDARGDDPVQVHPCRVKGYGVRELFLAYQLGDEALTAGHVEGEDGTGEDGSDDHGAISGRGR